MLFRLNLYDFTLVGFVQLFLATALLLSPVRRLSRSGSGSRFSEVFFSSIIAMAMAVPACWLVTVIWGVPLTSLELPGSTVVLIAVIVVIARPDLNPVAQIFSAAFIAAGLGLILFTIKLTTNDANGGFEFLVSGFFVLLSLFAVTLWNSYVNATTDVLGRFRHSRPLPKADPSYQPFVSLHIPAYNEPPELLIETIKAAERIDYPDFEIVVIDNNTKDPAVWRPGGGILPGSPARQVRARRPLARLQGGRLQPCPAPVHRPARRDHRPGRRRRSRQPYYLRETVSVLLRPDASASCRPSRATATSRAAPTTPPASTPSRPSTCRSCPRATSATRSRSSGRWGCSAAAP